MRFWGRNKIHSPVALRHIDAGQGTVSKHGDCEKRQGSFPAVFC